MATNLKESKEDASIYVITNLTNGKQYVGCTVKTIEKRFKGHKRQVKNGNDSYIHCAMRKYGFNNFSIKLLEICNLTDIYSREIYWIKKLDTFNNGYNLTSGGGYEGGYKLSEETKKKISKAMKGRVNSEETKRRMSEAAYKRKVTYSPELRARLSEVSKRKVFTTEYREKLSEAQSRLRAAKKPYYMVMKTNRTKLTIAQIEYAKKMYFIKGVSWIASELGFSKKAIYRALSIGFSKEVS